MHQALMSAMEDICGFVSSLIKRHLPEIHSQLSVFCDILPLNSRPSTHPFPGCVINLLAASEAHWDSRDDIICVVVPFWEFEGAELVLLEA
jgi:hypothetical protein